MKECLVIEKRGPWANEKINTETAAINNTETSETEKPIEIPQFFLREQYLRKEYQCQMLYREERNKRRKKLKWKKRLATTVECIKLLAGMIICILGFWSWVVIMIILFD